MELILYLRRVEKAEDGKTAKFILVSYFLYYQRTAEQLFISLVTRMPILEAIQKLKGKGKAKRTAGMLHMHWGYNHCC